MGISFWDLFPGTSVPRLLRTLVDLQVSAIVCKWKRSCPFLRMERLTYRAILGDINFYITFNGGWWLFHAFKIKPYRFIISPLFISSSIDLGNLRKNLVYACFRAYTYSLVFAYVRERAVRSFVLWYAMQWFFHLYDDKAGGDLSLQKGSLLWRFSSLLFVDLYLLH